MRLDLAFYGRDPRPIPVSRASDIERRAAWGAFYEDLKFIGAIAGTIAVGVALVWGWGVICG
jgi:hypothetical protein